MCHDRAVAELRRGASKEVDADVVGALPEVRAAHAAVRAG
jgi:hypothetical protein